MAYNKNRNLFLPHSLPLPTNSLSNYAFRLYRSTLRPQSKVLRPIRTSEAPLPAALAAVIVEHAKVRPGDFDLKAAEQLCLPPFPDPDPAFPAPAVAPAPALELAAATHAAHTPPRHLSAPIPALQDLFDTASSLASGDPRRLSIYFGIPATAIAAFLQTVDPTHPRRFPDLPRIANFDAGPPRAVCLGGDKAFGYSILRLLDIFHIPLWEMIEQGREALRSPDPASDPFDLRRGSVMHLIWPALVYRLRLRLDRLDQQLWNLVTGEDIPGKAVFDKMERALVDDIEDVRMKFSEVLTTPIPPIVERWSEDDEKHEEDFDKGAVRSRFLRAHEYPELDLAKGGAIMRAARMLRVVLEPIPRTVFHEVSKERYGSDQLEVLARAARHYLVRKRRLSKAEVQEWAHMNLSLVEMEWKLNMRRFAENVRQAASNCGDFADSAKSPEVLARMSLEDFESAKVWGHGVDETVRAGWGKSRVHQTWKLPRYRLLVEPELVSVPSLDLDWLAAVGSEDQAGYVLLRGGVLQVRRGLVAMPGEDERAELEEVMKGSGAGPYVNLLRESSKYHRLGAEMPRRGLDWWLRGQRVTSRKSLMESDEEPRPWPLQLHQWVRMQRIIDKMNVMTRAQAKHRDSAISGALGQYTRIPQAAEMVRQMQATLDQEVHFKAIVEGIKGMIQVVQRHHHEPGQWVVLDLIENLVGKMGNRLEFDDLADVVEWMGIYPSVGFDTSVQAADRLRALARRKVRIAGHEHLLADLYSRGRQALLHDGSKDERAELIPVYLDKVVKFHEEVFAALEEVVDMPGIDEWFEDERYRYARILRFGLRKVYAAKDMRWKWTGQYDEKDQRSWWDVLGSQYKDRLVPATLIQPRGGASFPSVSEVLEHMPGPMHDSKLRFTEFTNRLHIDGLYAVHGMTANERFVFDQRMKAKRVAREGVLEHVNVGKSWSLFHEYLTVEEKLGEGFEWRLKMQRERLESWADSVEDVEKKLVPVLQMLHLPLPTFIRMMLELRRRGREVFACHYHVWRKMMFKRHDGYWDDMEVERPVSRWKREYTGFRFEDDQLFYVMLAYTKLCERHGVMPVDKYTVWVVPDADAGYLIRGQGRSTWLSAIRYRGLVVKGKKDETVEQVVEFD